MKHVDKIYKEWYGESHLNTSNIPTHDSSEAADFAEYYYKEKSEPLKMMLNKILAIEDAAFGLKGFDYQRLKSEIRGALADAQ